MYAKYVTDTTSVQAEVINDIALLLSGSPISALSNSCDKANTTLISTVAPGWTLVDNAAPLNGRVLSAPDADGLTTKYVNLNTQSASLIGLTGYEAWNSVAHTGTNATTPSTVTYSTTTPNTYIIFATVRSFYFSIVNGDSGIGAFEFTRECEYLKGTTYPCFTVIDSASNGGLGAQARNSTVNTSFTPNYIPRSKNLMGGGDLTGASSYCVVSSISAKNNPLQYSSNNTVIYSSFITAPQSTRMFTDTGRPYYELRPLFAMTASGWWNNYSSKVSNGALLGKFYDVLETAANAGNNLDTFSDGTTTYVILAIANATYAFKMA